jgi:hypothetical protein
VPKNGVNNPIHLKNPSKDQNAATAAGQSANLTTAAPAALESPESAKPTSESAKPTPPVPGASKVSSDDFATTVAALVGMEVLEVPDEEMLDYEATRKEGRSMWLFSLPITTS